MFNILTYNIHKGFDRYNRDFVLHRIKEQLQHTEVDAVLLQEIQGRHLHHETRISSWPGVSQFEFLADSIWPHFAYGKNAIYRKGHHGNAILSKYEIREWNNLNLSRFRNASRSMLHGKIDLPGNDSVLHLLCVHLDLIGFERKRQIRELKQYFDDSIDDHEPVILGGDFNDWHGGLGKAVEGQLGMREPSRRTGPCYAWIGSIFGASSWSKRFASSAIPGTNCPITCRYMHASPSIEAEYPERIGNCTISHINYTK